MGEFIVSTKALYQIDKTAISSLYELLTLLLHIFIVCSFYSLTILTSTHPFYSSLPQSGILPSLCLSFAFMPYICILIYYVHIQFYLLINNLEFTYEKKCDIDLWIQFTLHNMMIFSDTQQPTSRFHSSLWQNKTQLCTQHIFFSH